MNQHGPTLPVSELIHSEKYRAEGETFRDAMGRVAQATSRKPEQFEAWRDCLLGMRFLPAGRVQASVGSPRKVTPYNCFVSGNIGDSFIDGHNSIMSRATEAAATMRMGGGIGYDFSTLRPRGATIKKLGSKSSGPVSFMSIFDAICQCIASSGHRRGAQMGVLRVDHPDIEEFIRSKTNHTKLKGFNISVAITDEFMECVRDGKPFDLRWGGEVWSTVDARNLWELIMRSTYDWADPGVLFIDRINEMNNLHYCEEITATNPCFTGDTKVWTAEYGHVPFTSLVGQTVDVLTESEDGRAVYRRMSDIRVTQKNSKLIKVSLDNGTHVRCTPDHKFFLKDGTTKEAQDLQNGDSLKGAHRVGHEVVAAVGTRLVTQVEFLKEREDVYCGTVDDPSHRFIVATGPNDGILVANCGEQPLPSYGACLLGSFNLVKYLYADLSDESCEKAIQTGTGDWEFNYNLFVDDIRLAVSAMDKVIDIATYPLHEQEQEAQNKRRMGLGITALANAGEILGHPYASEGFLEFERKVLTVLRDTAYLTSSQLAKEYGVFPMYSRGDYAESKFIKTLPKKIQAEIYLNGIRNSHLLSLAPTGTISITADNVSSAIEPVFAHEVTRTIDSFDGPQTFQIPDHAVKFFGVTGKRCAEVTVDEHLAVLAIAQELVDSAVSKTCNVPKEIEWDDFTNVYFRAWELGCKGCTTYRPGGKREAILVDNEPETEEETKSACFLDPVTGRHECE